MLSTSTSGGKRTGRPRVAIVTSYWGEDPTEAVGATRLIAGALARHADVAVVHLTEGPAGRYADSVFDVHPVRVRGAEPVRSALLRRALVARNGNGSVPVAALELLAEYDGRAEGVLGAIDAIDPEAVVVAGSRQPYALAALRDGGRRVVAIPFCSDRPQFASELARLVESADLVGLIHPGEKAAILAAGPGREDDVVPIDLALRTDPNARTEPLAGIWRVGAYVLLVRCFPAGGPRQPRAVNREVLRTAIGGHSVIEVDGDAWWLCHAKHWSPLPVNRNRVNFSRLIAHAEALVDVRPQGPVGRIAVESMLYGVPVVVPDDSAAKAHAEAANGGLWYRDVGELFDGARALVTTPLGGRLSAQAQRYARHKHGDIDDFVARMASLVLGTRQPRRKAARPVS